MLDPRSEDGIGVLRQTAGAQESAGTCDRKTGARQGRTEPHEVGSGGEDDGSANASYGRGRFTTLLVVRARASVPYLAAGLQVAAPAAFLGALVGEFTGAERGMGILIIQSMRSLDTDGLWALGRTPVPAIDSDSKLTTRPEPLTWAKCPTVVALAAYDTTAIGVFLVPPAKSGFPR